MAKGHEDFMDWDGRNTSGDMETYSFSFNVNSMTMTAADLHTTPAGHRTIYQCLSVSCNDDTAINLVVLKRKSDGWAFFLMYFIGGGIFDFPGQALGAGETITMDVYNYSGSTLNFRGTINWVEVTKTTT